MGNIIYRSRHELILDKACKDENIMTSKNNDIIAFGCRSPESKGEGYWDGAYVYIHHKHLKVAVVFQNNVDFISNDLTFDEGLKLYSDFLKKEWIPMTNQDITRTSGFIIET